MTERGARRTGETRKASPRRARRSVAIASPDFRSGRSLRRGRPPLRGAIVAWLAALLLVGCATVTNPVTGEREFTVLSTAEEVRLGQQSAQAVKEQIGLVRAPKLERVVNAIGERLAALSPRQDVSYRFAVADMPEPNAFALPGGWIYVSRGLLTITQSETELANVMGHEVGHVAALHAAQRQTRSTWVGLGTVLGTAAASVLGGGAAAQGAAQLGQVVGAGLIASYSRDQERQADQVGQDLSARGGWDPAGMASFLHTLERWSTLKTGEPRLPTFLDSHPMTSERVQTTRTRAAQISKAERPQVVGSREAFLRTLEGLLVGPDPAEGVVREAAFLHPGLDLWMALAPGWQTVNQPTALASQAPGGEALWILQAQGESGDPRRAAAAWLQQNEVEVLQDSRAPIGDWPAYSLRARGQSQSGPVELRLTWVAHPKLMLRLTGAASPARSDAYAPTFERLARSLRPLTAAERRSITERRLRVVEARAGESLAALSRRTGNAWGLEETAVANGLTVEARLAAGTPVKIAVEQPYRPESS